MVSREIEDLTVEPSEGSYSMEEGFFFSLHGFAACKQVDQSDGNP